MGVIEIAGIIEPWVVTIGTALQILGTVTLSVFTLWGVRIKEVSTVMVEGKPLTIVSVDKKWQGWAKLGLWVIIPGLFLSALPHLLRSGHQVFTALFG